jgi:hypothetical protein
LKLSKHAALAAVPAAAAVLLTAPAALASSAPVAGLGVSGPYIGDTVTNPQYYGTQADAIPGNTPVAPGTSAGFPVTFTDTGNVTETVVIGQAAESQESWLGGTQVPGSWISSTFPASLSLAPGQSVSGIVTVTVPAGAAFGEYDGLFQGSASAPGAGNVKLVTGAADREYVTVP